MNNLKFKKVKCPICNFNSFYGFNKKAKGFIFSNKNWCF